MKRTSLPRASLVASALALAPMLHAQDTVFEGKGAKASLIELYSSEGCSSCPPAEAWLTALKTSPGLWHDTFPVAFHVDYWDNLGWADRFASVTFTQRQLDYSTRLGADTVYTPEFVVNGREWRRGWLSARPPTDAAAKSGDLTVTLQAKDGKFIARYMPADSSAGDKLTLNLALLGFHLVSDVKHGENGGRTLLHDFVALGFRSTPLTHAGTTFTTGPLDVKPNVTDKPGAIVAWVSDSNGKIVQVTGGWLPKTADASQP